MSISSLASALLAGVVWDAGFSTPLILGPRAPVPCPSWAELRVECEVPVRLRSGIDGELLVEVSHFHAGRRYRTHYALPVEFPPGSHKLASVPFFLPVGAKVTARLRSGSFLAATFPRDLNARPLPQGPPVYGFLGSSRELSLLKKYVYDEGLGADTGVRLARLRADRLPARWELLAADGVIADAGSLASLDEEKRRAFLDYALSGGSLVVLGRRGELPPAAARALPGYGSTPFGLGRLALVERTTGWQKKALALALPQATRLSRSVPSENGLVARLDRITARSASARQLAFILGAYVVLAVPVSAFVFWRLGRKEQAWWASLLVAGGFTAFMILRGGAPLGGEVELKEAGVLCASAGGPRAVYGSVSAVYATGSERLSVVFREGALVRQALAPSLARSFTSARRARVEGRVVRDVFVPAHSVRQFVSTGSFDLEGELRAEARDGGGWDFENRTRLDLVNCVVRSGRQLLEVGGIPSRCNARTGGPVGQLAAPPGGEWQGLPAVFSEVGSAGGSCLLGWAKAPDPPRVTRGKKAPQAWWLCAFSLGRGAGGQIGVTRTGKDSFLIFLDKVPQSGFAIKMVVSCTPVWGGLTVISEPGQPTPQEIVNGGVLRVRLSPNDLDPDLPVVRLSLRHSWGFSVGEEVKVELRDLEVEL